VLYYGVVPICLPRPDQMGEMLHSVDRALRERGFAAVGDLVILVAGTQLEQAKSTNALLIHRVGPETPSSAEGGGLPRNSSW